LSKLPVSIDEFQHDYRSRFATYYDLMPYTVNEILLVSDLYSDFILEEDGKISEEMFTAYRKLNLSSLPPRIIRVSTGADAITLIKERHFDLIITMRRLTDIDPFEFGRQVKEINSNYPVVLLLTSFADITGIDSTTISDSIDKTFVFSGNSDIILAIIKIVEDLRNIDSDIKHGQVRAVIVVEDTIQYYSLFLPLIYRELIRQTWKLMEEGVNIEHRALRRKVRPKILLAQTYEEAITLYEKYKDYLLGIISDVGFPRNGEKDFNAGYDLIKHVREEKEYLPILIQSSDPSNEEKARSLKAEFVHKNTPDYLRKFRIFMKDHMLLGDFKFRNNQDQIIAHAKDLAEFEMKLKEVTIESIVLHGSKNHFSNWLYARGEFEIANKLAKYRIKDFESLEELREFLLQSIHEVRKEKQIGVITEFSREEFDFSIPFTRIGNDSLGGKGRGLAFINSLLISSDFSSSFPNIDIKIPETIVIATDLFDQFLDENDLYGVILTDYEDDEIIEMFLSKDLPDSLVQDLTIIIENSDTPLAIRSSSLLEDSQFLPFAGIYHTYFLSNDQSKASVRHLYLQQAVKLVYASAFTKLAKSYIRSMGQKIEVEKMAVVIQKVVGKTHENRYYPDFSGVAESYNYYPVSYMEPKDGIAQIAVGLGETIVSGKKALSFCPRYPQILPQMSSPEDTIKNSQNEFIALMLKEEKIDLKEGEYATLKTYEMETARDDDALNWLAGVYDVQNNRIINNLRNEGPLLITFPFVLQYNKYPLADILQRILILGEKSFGSSVEIEFAVNLDTVNNNHEFSVLQIRPLVLKENHFTGKIIKNLDNSIIYTHTALGNGKYLDIRDIIFVKPETFENTKTLEIKDEIDEINQKLSKEEKEYVLIGPGRWGTRDRFLGIPVKWNNIHKAKIIVETGLEHFQIDPSQGMHFFSNIISTGKGYFTIPYGSTSDYYINWEWLSNQSPLTESTYVKHIRLKTPVTILIDGKKGIGAVLKEQNP
jgi:CheY-like chemotaxis protein